MTTRIGVQVPPGLSSGQSIQFQTPSGMMMQAQIPAGVSAGQTFYVDVPNAAPVAVAKAVVAPQGEAPRPLQAPQLRGLGAVLC